MATVSPSEIRGHRGWFKQKKSRLVGYSQRQPAAKAVEAIRDSAKQPGVEATRGVGSLGRANQSPRWRATRALLPGGRGSALGRGIAGPAAGPGAADTLRISGNTAVIQAA